MKNTSNDAECLQALFDALGALRVDLKCISENVRTLENQREFCTLKFNQEGALTSTVDNWRSGSETLSAEHTDNICIRSACEMLPRDVESLIADHDKADVALRAIPIQYLDLLDPLNGDKPWRASVLLDCLDKILFWPGAPDEFTRRRITPDVRDVLRLLADHTPFDTWDSYCKLLEQYRREVKSLRHELLTATQVDGTATPDSEESAADKSNSPLVSDGYVAASKIGWQDQFATYKKFTSFLDSTPTIRTKHPRPNRLAIHAADWLEYWANREAGEFDSIDVAPEAISSALARKAKLDKTSGRK